MNATAISSGLALMLAMVSPAMAQTAQSHTHHPAAAAAADVDVPAAAEAAVDVAERFNTALSNGDLATVGSLLAADVLILESGGGRAQPRGISGPSRRQRCGVPQGRPSPAAPSACTNRWRVRVGRNRKRAARPEGRQAADRPEHRDDGAEADRGRLADRPHPLVLADPTLSRDPR